MILFALNVWLWDQRTTGQHAGERVGKLRCPGEWRRLVPPRQHDTLHTTGEQLHSARADEERGEKSANTKLYISDTVNWALASLCVRASVLSTFLFCGSFSVSLCKLLAIPLHEAFLAFPGFDFKETFSLNWLVLFKKGWFLPLFLFVSVSCQPVLPWSQTST